MNVLSLPAPEEMARGPFLKHVPPFPRQTGTSSQTQGRRGADSMSYNGLAPPGVVRGAGPGWRQILGRRWVPAKLIPPEGSSQASSASRLPCEFSPVQHSLSENPAGCGHRW